MLEPLDQPIKLLFAFVTPAAIVWLAPKLYEVGDGIIPVPPFKEYLIVYEATLHCAVRVILFAPTVTVAPGA